MIGFPSLVYDYIIQKMKGDKVFVRYKNFNENQPHNRQRESRKPIDRKKYAEKPNKVREAVRVILDTFQPTQAIPHNISQLIDKFPRFFSDKVNTPERDSNELLNDVVIFNAKKYIESLSFKKEQEPQQSSSDPDWNSDEDFDGNIKSKEIQETVIEKIVEKLSEQPTKKQQILKRHEKEFLEDYFKSKRLQEQADRQNAPKIPQKAAEKQPAENVVARPKESQFAQFLKQQAEQRPRNIWSEYQEKQVNSFVDMGFMTKINDNQEEIQAELAEDDGMFLDEDQEAEEAKEEEKSQKDSEGDDDIFGDEHPTTTVKAVAKQQPKPESQKLIAQGLVVINDHVFSKIAEQVGLHPARCNWIISNQKEKYKVSTEYMDLYYRKEKINEILPYISLSHSEFIRNQDAETPSALETFRKFNARKDRKYQPRPKNQYKEKPHSHHKK